MRRRAWATAPGVGVAVGMVVRAEVSLRKTPGVADLGEQASGQQQIDHHPRRQITQPPLGGAGRGQSLIDHVEGHKLGELTKMVGRVTLPRTVTARVMTDWVSNGDLADR